MKEINFCKILCLFFLILLKYDNALCLNQTFKIVCYFANWAAQRPGLGSMFPEHIDPCLCTHMIYAFSDMKDNELSPLEKYDQGNSENLGFYGRFNRLKIMNPKLKTLIAVGGWEMGMSSFGLMANDERNITKFVTLAIKYLRKWQFDGLDLDFEYPGIEWRGSPANDTQSFTKLCKMLREAFEKESQDSGNDRLLLTAAFAGARDTIDKAYEVDKLSEYLDWFNLMTYDLHGSWDGYAGHHSALYGKKAWDFLCIDFIVKHYESKGAPRNKLVVGLATYGRTNASAMPYTGFKGESGLLSYYELCIMLACEGWNKSWNEAQLVPFALSKTYDSAGYDNVESMEIKAKYIINQNLGGAMFWGLDLDDFTGTFCCQGRFPLIRAVKSILENSPDIMPPVNICNKCPTQEYKTMTNRSVDDVLSIKRDIINFRDTKCVMSNLEYMNKLNQYQREQQTHILLSDPVSNLTNSRIVKH